MFDWKSLRYRLERRALELLADFIPWLSRAHCVKLGLVLGDLAFAVDRRGRAVAFANLECVFGERYSVCKKRAIVRGSYRNFVRTMLDLFWARNITRANFREYLRLEGFEDLCARHAARAGFVCVTTHQGTFEWANLAGGFQGFGNFVVTENFKNPLLDEVFVRAREACGATMIRQENSMVRLLKVVKRGGVAALLLDLNCSRRRPRRSSKASA